MVIPSLGHALALGFVAYLAAVGGATLVISFLRRGTVDF